nr:ribonuclease H-like domain-containing protein [Tanacetum cinerariifolium]
MLHMGDQSANEYFSKIDSLVTLLSELGSDETYLPQALNTMTLQEPVDLKWNMDTTTSSHINSSTSNLSTIFNSCMYPSVLVGDEKSIPKYATEVLEHAGMLTCNPCRTPADTDSKLSADGDPVSDPTLYRSLAGALQYLTFTPSDISYAVHFTSPRPLLWLLIQMRIGLVVPLHVDLLLAIVFFLAIIFFLGRPRDSLPSLVLVLKRNIEVFPMQLLRLAGCVIFYRTKHIEIDIHFVRDLVSTSRIRVLHIPSHYLYADIFTKGLPTTLFDEFHSSLSVRSSPAQTAGGC